MCYITTLEGGGGKKEGRKGGGGGGKGVFLKRFYLADPRQWTRENVATWLLHARVQYQLGNTHPECFPMNGKSLLLMTREMFLSRVPEGGGVLFEDIQLKLQKVISELYNRAATATGSSGQESALITLRR